MTNERLTAQNFQISQELYDRICNKLYLWNIHKIIFIMVSYSRLKLLRFTTIQILDKFSVW